jgi:hypothetical protein
MCHLMTLHVTLTHLDYMVMQCTKVMQRVLFYVEFCAAVSRLVCLKPQRSRVVCS